MISIIIPAYNQADKISKCFGSILSQSILHSDEEVEVIVVNDGSSDNIIGMFKKYDPLFEAAGVSTILINQENRGANAARNRGFSEAQGENVIFCDADITMDNDMLAVMRSVLTTDPQASYAYSSFWWGRKLFKLFPFDGSKLKEMPYIHTTSLIRRSHFPGFDEKINRFQDWDLWLTMFEKGRVGKWIDKPLFRVETGGTMSNWLPGIAYKLFPFLPAVKKYKQAMEIIKKKHSL